MVIKEIPRGDLSYWEMLWDSYPERRRVMLEHGMRYEKYGHCPSKEVPTAVRRYGIGHPFYFFKMDTVAEKAECREGKLCENCWERLWQGEAFDAEHCKL